VRETVNECESNLLGECAWNPKPEFPAVLTASRWLLVTPLADSQRVKEFPEEKLALEVPS
jgi:hypothetical protein